MAEDKTFWDEEWKKIYFEGIDPNEKYEVSNYGRIKKWEHKKDEWVVQKPANVNGYAYFSFKTTPDVNNRKRVTKSLHRIIADLFLPPKETEEHNNVIHLDFNKWNNNIKNLRWATRDEMFKHSRKSPRTAEAIENRKGEVTNSKLTETEVMRLKIKLMRGRTPLYKIAKEFGITHTQLNRIRFGLNWAHVKVKK